MKTLILSLAILTTTTSRADQLGDEFMAVCKLKTDDGAKAVASMALSVTAAETDPAQYNPRQALADRRTLQRLGPKCYRWLKDNLGLGNSPLTGE
jgi:hypothetical protein